MRFPVKLFGVAKQRAGADEVDAVLEGAAIVKNLRDALASARPELAGLLRSARFAVNQEIAPEDRALREGDEIALITPVSGG